MMHYCQLKIGEFDKHNTFYSWYIKQRFLRSKKEAKSKYSQEVNIIVSFQISVCLGSFCLLAI